MNLSCIVIDDEPLAIRQMESYISKIPVLNHLESFDSAIEAKAWLEEGNNTDIIFVDINMPELTGVDFVRGLESRHLVIFTTAYSEYAIEGFKLDAIDYLLNAGAYFSASGPVSNPKSNMDGTSVRCIRDVY